MPKSTVIEAQKAPVPENRTGSILLAEDSPVYRRLIAAHLKEWGFDCICAKDGKAAWKLLMKQDAPRLAILDWVLPEIDGVDLCRRLRGRPKDDPYTYAILLTAKNRQHEMLEAMDAGADDFLAKPFDPLELKARLLVGQRIVELQEKLVSANSALQFVASHDFLTGAWNRAEIVAFMHRELARTRRDATPVGIVLVDVDHFKAVNDRFGHEVGDTVLKEITKRLSTSLREYDGIGRYGGEEFLLVIPGCDLPTTGRRADQIREAIARTPIMIFQGELTVTVSMGATVAESSSNSELLLRHADAALYDAKRNGRNRVEMRIAQVPEAETHANCPPLEIAE
jgi:two-component system, cell cycle response regulator